MDTKTADAVWAADMALARQILAKEAARAAERARRAAAAKAAKV